MTKVRMAELTGGEARERLARRPVVLLPMGSHEDQGPHAPMGDYLSADGIAERIARRAGERGVDTVVAPVLPFGGADYFGAMIGGIALQQATLRAVISDMLACLVRHKLTRIVVINGHGGNVQAIHEATQAVYKEHGALIPELLSVARRLHAAAGHPRRGEGEEGRRPRRRSAHQRRLAFVPVADAPGPDAEPDAAAAGDGPARRRLRHRALRRRRDHGASGIRRDRPRRRPQRRPAFVFAGDRGKTGRTAN
jgi:hypothetical protein